MGKAPTPASQTPARQGGRRLPESEPSRGRERGGWGRGCGRDPEREAQLSPPTPAAAPQAQPLWAVTAARLPTWHRGHSRPRSRPPPLRTGQRRRLTSAGTGRFSAAAFSSSTESVWRSLSGAVGCGRRSQRLRRSRTSLPAGGGSAGGGSSMLPAAGRAARPGLAGSGARSAAERRERGGASGGGSESAAPRRVAVASWARGREVRHEGGAGGMAPPGGWEDPQHHRVAWERPRIVRANL